MRGLFVGNSNPYLSGTSIICQHGANSQFFRVFSTFGPMHQNVVTSGGGGVCVCFLKSVREGHFRNVWVGGGGVGGRSFEHRAVQGTTHRKWQCSRDHSLFRIRVIVIPGPLHKSWDSIGARIPLLVTAWEHISSIFPKQPAFLDWHPPCVQGHGPQAVSCEVHILLFAQLDLAPCNGLAVP